MLASNPGAALPSRQSELRCGHAVQGRPSARRIDVAPADDSADLESVRGSRDRLVCLRGECALPDVNKRPP